VKTGGIFNAEHPAVIDLHPLGLLGSFRSAIPAVFMRENRAADAAR